MFSSACAPLFTPFDSSLLCSQEVAADANAARKRSSVESLVMSEAQRRSSARDRTDAVIPQSSGLLSPAGLRKNIDVADEEGDGDVAGHLAPEEPPAPVKSHALRKLGCCYSNLAG